MEIVFFILRFLAGFMVGSVVVGLILAYPVYRFGYRQAVDKFPYRNIYNQGWMWIQPAVWIGYAAHKRGYKDGERGEYKEPQAWDSVKGGYQIHTPHDESGPATHGSNYTEKM